MIGSAAANACALATGEKGGGRALKDEYQWSTANMQTFVCSPQVRISGFQ